MNDSPADLTFTASAAAFGDGTHPSTRGILAALESVDPTLFQPEMACDMGCGSGILALAIARLFDCPVVAVDIAAESIETVRLNAAQNDLTKLILPLQNAGFTHPFIETQGPYDLIVMNILADPLIALASDAERHLAPEGVLILSGLLLWQESAISTAYETLGLELTSRLTLGDWATLIFQKP